MNSLVNCLSCRPVNGDDRVAHKLKTCALDLLLRSGPRFSFARDEHFLKGNLLALFKATADFQISCVIGYKTGVQFQSRNENDSVALL